MRESVEKVDVFGWNQSYTWKSVCGDLIEKVQQWRYQIRTWTSLIYIYNIWRKLDRDKGADTIMGMKEIYTEVKTVLITHIKYFQYLPYCNVYVNVFVPSRSILPEIHPLIHYIFLLLFSHCIMVNIFPGIT